MTSQRKLDLVSVVTIACLLIVAALLLWWTPGDWWIATPRASHWVSAVMTMVTYLVLCVWIAWIPSRGPSVKQTSYDDNAANSLEEDTPSDVHNDAKVVVLYASQTGTAEELAIETATRLTENNIHSEITAIDELHERRWCGEETFLIIASTAGQGEPPDHAFEFAEELMNRSIDMTSLRYGILALGDSDYEEYCAFGRQINEWLTKCGAQPLFDIIEVDDGDRVSIEQWESQVDKITIGRGDIRETTRLNAVAGPPLHDMQRKMRDSVSL
ncbi:sulfite reductase (NADPH) flavoprotein alpha-component [Rhodopirellula rubra]|uniref:Sulfite reductase (NADPH) flavoprotein alpha-component n=1 Tax=Aporhodopirellula rubra TaxID=980271 RepID=A0A7W5E380_9BACT|nr:flavodoxin domain-containing protein [Aporhodopirellula rubra]MBB3209340.1 sulfite reductase (NADPH) flavoprotein alpha-component [Aporhodopirellula rubra]